MRNEDQNEIKIDAKFDTEEERKTWEIEDVENTENGAERETVVKKQGSRGSVAERNWHEEIMENWWKSIKKSMKNLYKIDVGKSIEKWQQNNWKWEPKELQKSMKIYKNDVPESGWKMIEKR